MTTHTLPSQVGRGKIGKATGAAGIEGTDHEHAWSMDWKTLRFGSGVRTAVRAGRQRATAPRRPSAAGAMCAPIEIDRHAVLRPLF